MDVLTDDIYRALAVACPELENLANLAAPPKGEALENGFHDPGEGGGSDGAGSQGGAEGGGQAQGGAGGEDPPPNGPVADECTLLPLQIQALFKNVNTVHDKPVYVYGRLREGGGAMDRGKRKKWENDLLYLAATCPEVTSYKCRRGQRYMDNSGINMIAELFPKLTALELYHTSVDDNGLRVFFAEHKGSLTELVLDNPGSVTDAGLEAVAFSCPDLQYLKVSHVAGVTNDGIEFVARKCSRLTQLHINNKMFSFRSSEAQSVCQISNNCLIDLSNKCPRLNNFRLFNSGEVSCSGIQGLAAGCRFLAGIMLYECPLVDDKCLEAMRDMPFLKAAVLVNCDAMTPEGVIQFVLHAPAMWRLTLMVNSERCTSFFGDQSAIADKVYAMIDAEDNKFRPSPMRKLSVEGVGGNFIQLLTVLCPDLHTLDFRDGVVINQTAFRTVLTNCEKLKVLDVQNLSGLRDGFLEACAEYGAALKKIALGFKVKGLSTEALTRVVQHCPSLKFISMDFNFPVPIPTASSSPAAHDATPAAAAARAEEVPGCSGEGAGSEDNQAEEANGCPGERYPDLDRLLSVARETHGGLCYVHVLTDERRPFDVDEATQTNRHVELHFTPRKYLSSISCARESASQPSGSGAQ